MEGKEKLGKDLQNGSDTKLVLKEEPTVPKEEDQPPQPETNADSNPGDDQIMRDAFEDHMATDEPNVGDVKANDSLLTEVPIAKKGNGGNARVTNKLKTVEKHVEESKSWLSDSEVLYFESKLQLPDMMILYMNDCIKMKTVCPGTKSQLDFFLSYPFKSFCPCFFLVKNNCSLLIRVRNQGHWRMGHHHNRQHL